MKFFIATISLFFILSACNSSTPPRDNQPMQKEEEVKPKDARETNSYSKDRKVPDIIQR